MSKKIIYIIPSIILYICAGLMILYTIWAYMNCMDIISQAKAAGQLASSGNEYDIISFYMNNCSQYLVFALLLGSAGLLLQKDQPVSSSYVADSRLTQNEAENNELDEWFDDTPNSL